MNIEQSTQFQEGTSTTFVLPYSKEYIFYSDQHNTGVAIEAEDRAQSLEGTGIECARFIENNGISLEGKIFLQLYQLITLKVKNTLRFGCLLAVMIV